MKKNKLTGIDHIVAERKEQIEKHGFDVKNDRYYNDNELIKAALFAINPNQFEWPYKWAARFRHKIQQKDELNRLRVAGALIASRIDQIIHLQQD